MGACVYAADVSQAHLTMDMFGYFACWGTEGPQRTFGVVSFFGLYMYQLSFLTLGASFAQSADSTDDVRWQVKWLALESVFKFFILIAQSFVPLTPGLCIQTLCFLVLTTYLMCNVDKNDQNICSIYPLGWIKLALYMAYSWASFVATVASFLKTPKASWVPFVVMISMLPVIAVWCYGYFFAGYPGNPFLEDRKHYMKRKDWQKKLLFYCDFYSSTGRVLETRAELIDAFRDSHVIDEDAPLMAEYR